MKCPRCQAENDAGAGFCEDCGARLEAACPSCGTPVTPGKKFCRSCGAALTTAPAGRFASPESYIPKHLAEKILTSKTALEGERKQVTVLFADLKGSMELLADRDPEEARKILDPVIERMMEAVHRYEGTVNQVMGDGIMALFGAPLAHEDHAVRACYAALRMQDSVRRYSDELHRAQGVEVQIRVGVNSGDVVVRSIGSDLRMDYSRQFAAFLHTLRWTFVRIVSGSEPTDQHTGPPADSRLRTRDGRTARPYAQRQRGRVRVPGGSCSSRRSAGVQSKP
jgi:hypothetical protein